MKEIAQVPPAPARPAESHKGTFGTVIVVGGSATMIGAPALCASAALRSGAGLVKIATGARVLPFALTIEPGATGIELRAGVAAAGQLDKADVGHKAVLAVGPGMGLTRGNAALLTKLLRGTRRMVLDADGLTLLAATGKPRPSPGPELVMTPHPGEFVRLAKSLGIKHNGADPRTRPAAAATLAQAHRAVVVLKGYRTVVSDGRRFYVNHTGNPALATAGSGDVLTGLVAALLAQGMTSLDAAVLGVHLHGGAADLWAAMHGPCGLTARDLAGLLPNAFERHRRNGG